MCVLNPIVSKMSVNLSKKIKVSKMYVVLLSGKLDGINSIKLLVLPLLGGILD